jgi:hypothetical protein
LKRVNGLLDTSRDKVRGRNAMRVFGCSFVRSRNGVADGLPP